VQLEIPPCQADPIKKKKKNLFNSQNMYCLPSTNAIITSRTQWNKNPNPNEENLLDKMKAISKCRYLSTHTFYFIQSSMWAGHRQKIYEASVHVG
jgi:hypothetical protein